MKRLAILLFLVLLAGSAPQARRAEASSPTLMLGVGCDLFEISSGSVNVSVPEGFFSPGSDAYFGSVLLHGQHIGTRGPWELGTTDLVLARRSKIALPDAPSSQNEIVKAMELSVVGGPISVVVGGVSQLWTVRVGLDTTKPFPHGALALARDGASNGTFDATLPILPVVTFTRMGVTKSYTMSSTTLSGVAGTWTTVDLSDTSALVATKLPLAFALSISLTSADLSLVLVAPGADPAAPGPASIDSTATVHSTAKLGRGCSVDAGAAIGAGAVVGPGCHIGTNATIGPNVVLGSGTTVSGSCSVNAGAFVSNNCSIGSSSTLGAGCYLSKNCTTGTNCGIASNCKLLDGATLADSVFIGGGCRIGAGCTFGAGASVNAGLELAAGTSVAAGATQFSSTSTDVSGVSVSAQPAVGPLTGLPGILATCIPVDAPSPPAPPPTVTEDLEKLKDDIGSDKARSDKGIGGSGPPYVENGYDCEDYAEALRAKLASTPYGYSTTFTVVRTVKKNPDYGWWDQYGLGTDPEYIQVSSHCLVDIHVGNRVRWLEAQMCGHPPPLKWGATNNPSTDLDKNDDGKVTYASDAGTEPTETAPDGTEIRVEVYSSQADANAHGAAAGDD